MRLNADQMTFANENRALFPIQYHAAMGMLDHGVRAAYARGAGFAPRTRGLPYSISTPATTELVAEKFRMDIRSRRFFVRSAGRISIDTPIAGTPTTAVGKRNHERTISANRRAIEDMRRVDVGFGAPRYYPVRVPSIESIARLLVSMAVDFPGFDVEMAKREISHQLPDYADCIPHWRYSCVQSFPAVSLGALMIWSSFILRCHLGGMGRHPI